MENKGNVIVIRIAVFATSIFVLLGALIFYAVSGESHWNNRYKRSEKKAIEYTGNLDYYMELRDYIAVYEYSEANDIYFRYDSDYEEYTYAIRATEYFDRVYNYLLGVKMGETSIESYKQYTAKNLTSYVFSIYQQTSEEKISENVESDNIKTYLEYLRKDTGLFLQAYLNLTQEETEKLPTMTENQIGVLLEEVFDK